MSDADAVVGWDAPPESLDTIAAELRELRALDGSPSFTEIMKRAKAVRADRGLPDHEQAIARSTVYDCFRDGRRRIDVEAVTDVALALGLPPQRRREWSRRVSAAHEARDRALIAVAQNAAPSPVPNFAGRTNEIDAARQALTDTTSLVWVSGMGGMGKTQLVLEIARRHDGPLLFLDLRGFTAEAPPVDAPAAQRTILRSLGADERLPVKVSERYRRVRETLTESGALLILDDAADPEQVTAILGKKAAGRVLVTSRALPPSENWTHLSLHGLDSDETAAILGPQLAERGASEEDIALLSQLFGGLPLATALLAGRITTHPEWTLAEHIEVMSERMESARVEDELRATIELSYGALPGDAARLLRIFADVPLAELSVEGAAAALDVAQHEAASAVSQLIDRSLAVPRDNGAIALHSLIRVFAREKTQEIDPPSRRRASFGRVALYAARTTWSAYETIGASFGEGTRRTAFTWPSREWTADEATAWLQRNLAALLSLAHSAPGRGHPELLFRLSEGLSWWLNLRGLHTDALRLHEAAAEFAADESDADAQAMAGLDAGQLLLQSDRLDDALAHFQRAQRLISGAGDLTDPGLEGLLLNMSAVVQMRHGKYDDAVAALHRSIEIHEERGEGPRTLSAYVNLTVALSETGRFEEERAVLVRAHAAAREMGHDLFTANLLINESTLEYALGEYDAALARADEATTLAESLDMKYYTASAHAVAATALRALGDLPAARTRVDTAFRLAKEMGAFTPIAEVLITSAQIAVAENAYDRADRELREADDLLIVDGDDRLRGSMWLVRADMADDPRLRRDCLSRALTHFQISGTYEAADVQKKLAELG